MKDGKEVAVRQTCFVAMPIATRPADAEQYDGDLKHWAHVIEALFVPAVEAAGYEVIRPEAVGSHLIHASIVRHLTDADMVLCDLSGHNPNVFFELGVRTALDRPIALVRDEHTALPFDTSGVNTHAYSSKLYGWEIESQRAALAEHIRESQSSCAGRNPLWRYFGLTTQAREPRGGAASPMEARLDLLAAHVDELSTAVQSGLGIYGGYASEGTWEASVRSGKNQDLFLDSLRRYVSSRNDIGLQSNKLSNGHLLLTLDGPWGSNGVARLRDLMAKYEVRDVTIDGPRPVV